MVEDNYYEKELAYEGRIEKIRNMSALGGEISISQDGDDLIIIFPDIIKGKKPEGTILFYRPSNQKMDYSLPVKLNDSAKQIVDAGKLVSGKYILKIDWSLDGKDYYQEETLIRNE